MAIFRLGAALVLATVLAGCGGTASAPSSTVTALTITGATSLTGVGQTSQLALTGTLSSGGLQAVTTSQATWQSSNTAVAAVSAAGLVTAQGYGGTTIKATYLGMTTEVAFLVTIAGTWVAVIPDGSSVTWVLTQSQGLVNGTFSIVPLAVGTSLSAATVNGTVSGSTFTWTMTATIGSVGGHPECVGLTLIDSGIAQVQSGGASMSATIQGAMGVCDPNFDPSLPGAAAITFTRQ